MRENPFKRKYIHPDTQDVLTFSEQISWKVQGVIRNWWFVILWTATTVVWWLTPHWFLDTNAYIHWMNLASWLAVTVELIIGIAMIGQTKRDAQILRASRKALFEMHDLLGEMRAMIHEVRDLEEEQIDLVNDIIEEMND